MTKVDSITRAFAIIDRSLREFFPGDFYKRCMYASFGMAALLNDDGMRAQVVGGDFLCAVVSDDGQQTLLFPLNYSNYNWVTTPSSSYPDTSGYELFDRHVGDPRNPLDPTWVGVNGTAQVTIDLGSTKRVDWVGVQTLTYPGWGIRSPVTLDIYCGPTTASLTKVATATAPFTQAALAGSNGEEYVLGNRTPLGVNCRFLDLRMPNGYWTFIGEVEASRE